MIVLDVQQGSVEWLRARLGIPTASCFDRIMTPKARKLSGSASKYMCELLAERLLGHPIETMSTDFMVRGTQLEPAAASAYEFERDCDTTKVGFVLDDSRRFGCSPDRLVGEDGLLEIKCQSAGVHVAAMLGLSDDGYMSQCQGQMWVTGRNWVDRISYNPDLPMAVVRINRDDDYITDLSKAVESFCDLLDKAEKQIAETYAQAGVKR